MIFTEEVILRFKGQPTGEYDDLGNPIIGPPRDEPWPAWYEVGSSSEATDAREQQVWGYTVALPLEAPLDAADAVVIDDEEYQVQGMPGRQPGGHVVEGYTVAIVQRVEG